MKYFCNFIRIRRSRLCLNSVLWILFFNLINMPDTRALVVDDLNVARVLTAEKGSIGLESGAQEGLLQVIIKASGSPDAQNNSVVLESLKGANRMYYQYSFSTTDQFLEVDEKKVPAWQLTLHFDMRAVNRVLKQAGLPEWGKNRPVVLVWLAVNEGRGSYLMGSEDESEIKASLDREAGRRGLPLIYPLLDLEDTAAVSERDIGKRSLDKIEEASERYHPDAILVAEMTKQNGRKWSSNWQYKPGDRWLGIGRKQIDLEILTAEMIDRLANELASLYAHGGEESHIWVKVEDLASVKDYAGMSQYMESLSMVQMAFVEQVEANAAWYRMKITGNRNQLIETMALDRRIRLVDSGDGMSRDTAIVYRWAD